MSLLTCWLRSESIPVTVAGALEQLAQVLVAAVEGVG